MSILGTIDWQTEVSGFCRCLGESLNTRQNGKKDCRVSLDGAPTIFCFHASCIGAVTEANRRLRRELNASPWELRLPDGRTLRSGDVLRADGTVVKREPWSVERDAEDQFRTWLKIWPACSTVSIGDVYSSGRPEHRSHFRPVAEWYQLGPVMGNFTCGSSFKPGCYSRSNENLDGHWFMVIESDSLSKDEVGAVFGYLRRRLRYELFCIVDTASKSLHAWFEALRNRLLESRLKAGLEVFGCDPKVFTYSQPVRVPGAWREGRLQRLVWLKG